MPTILIPINTNLATPWDTEFYNQETIVKTFGMPLPSHVEIHFTEELVAKMVTIAQLAASEDLAKIEIISSFHRDTNKSKVTFYKDGDLLPISQYDDFDKLWPTVDSEVFMIINNSFYGGAFCAEFIYTNASCYELVFQTHYFNLEQIIP